MLNIFNRVVTILALLGLIALSALCTAALFLPAALRGQLGTSIASLWAMPQAMDPNQRLLLAALGILGIVIAFLALVMELRPPENDGTVRVKSADGSELAIARSAITQRVQYSVDHLDDVVQVDPIVTGKGSSLTVHLDVTTAPHVDVPMKTEEIRAVTRDVIEKQMGLVLKKVTVKLDHDKFRDVAADGTLM